MRLNSNYLMLIKKRVYFNKKMIHPNDSSGNSPTTLTISYFIEHWSLIMFFECVLVVSHLPYAEDFKSFRQKEQLKIKIEA